MALVALLLVCNVTISHGTLNGLVFYANVVSISGLSTLQNCSIHPILSTFIAWVNLDFGVETCFYPGMNTYQKTWLQLTFPLYIWSLVGAIILASYYSSTAMKVFGRNNVAILATLFLLSYTKILKTIITALNFTEVLQGGAHNVSDSLMPYKVWTYDGNIEYLKGKHVPLFAVALVFLVFFFLPYTLLLTFGQCLRSMPIKIRCILWFIRSTAFISIMDAYHAPYNRRHRYWIGLMLLIHCVLFLAFVLSYRDSELLAHMYTITLILIAIFTFKMTFAMRVYRRFPLDVLELCFLLNLVILSATLYYLRGNGSSDSVVMCNCTTASVSVSLVLFIAILVNHTYIRISKTKLFVSTKGALAKKWPKRNNHNTLPENSDIRVVLQKLPTTSNVDLREPLLASAELCACIM
jgi:hypothetical protein